MQPYCREKRLSAFTFYSTKTIYIYFTDAHHYHCSPPAITTYMRKQREREIRPGERDRERQREFTETDMYCLSRKKNLGEIWS